MDLLSDSNIVYEGVISVESDYYDLIIFEIIVYRFKEDLYYGEVKEKGWAASAGSIENAIKAVQNIANSNYKNQKM